MISRTLHFESNYENNETIFGRQTGRQKYNIVCSYRKVQWETFGVTVRWSCSKFSSKFSCADYCLSFL